MDELEDELQELAQKCDLAEKTITKPPTVCLESKQLLSWLFKETGEKKWDADFGWKDKANRPTRHVRDRK